ncbi:MAG: AMP-binding protein [Pseudomonadota bacterium]
MNTRMTMELESLTGSPLLAGAAYLDRVAVIGSGQSWTWRQVHLAASALARQFDQRDTICNLCISRVGFLVTWLAALRSDCLQILPPSGGQADLVAILKSCSDPVVVVDDAQLLQPQWTEHARCLVNSPDASRWSICDEVSPWVFDWNSPNVRLYTSGSTGAPEPQTRTLGQLTRGALVLGKRLDEEVGNGLVSIKSIVCSVPPQHMFGLETSVMLSLAHGIPVLDRRPLLPADVKAAFELVGDGAVWITTPLHLRALIGSGDELPNCRVVIASTMALDTVVATHSERLANAPVLEIYGSTETGVVAMRRTARDSSWRPVHNVRIDASEESNVQVWGSHFPSPQSLTDHIEIDEDGSFKLLGRHGDLIKIAGRRASLAGLNLMLNDLPGLTDGVFYLPTTGAPADRLVLIHAGPPLDLVATEHWLRERMDPVFLPRVVICVSSLERTDTGKLSRAVLDRIYAAWRSERRGDESV